MSTILVDNLTGKTSAGSITVTSEGGAATQSLQQGLAKAWANLNGIGTIALRDSLNISSATDLGTGYYKKSYTNSMSNINYSSVFGGQYGSGAGVYTTLIGIRNETNYDDPVTTTFIEIVTIGHDGATDDHECANTNIHGDIA